MADKPKLDDLLAARRKRSTYRGAELQCIRREQGLTMIELAEILHCSERAAYLYLADELPMLSCRWRLLLLECGLARPNWTTKRRIKRFMAKFLGDATQTRVCESCRGPFQARARAKTKFCSTACRQRPHRRRVAS